MSISRETVSERTSGEDLHIFPFCRQSQVVGLEEAIAIVDGTPFLASDGDNFTSIVKTAIRRRIAELTGEEAA